MVERSRRRREMHEMTKTRMLLTTTAFAAMAAFVAGSANAYVTDGDSATRGTAAAAASVDESLYNGAPGTIPYMSHGIGVDESLFSGEQQAQPGDPGTIPYLSHGIGVDKSLFEGGERSLGLTGDSPRTRVAAPEPEGLTGDSAATRYPAGGVTVTASSGDDNTDWTSFGLGAAMGALVAAGLAGVVLTARHRGRVALP
jgi:hypothetical protein